MKCLGEGNWADEPFTDWEIFECDSFGNPGDALGGVTGLVHTAEQALQAFLAFAPELAVYPLIAMRSPIAPAWSSYGWV